MLCSSSDKNIDWFYINNSTFSYYKQTMNNIRTKFLFRISLNLNIVPNLPALNILFQLLPIKGRVQTDYFLEAKKDAPKTIT